MTRGASTRSQQEGQEGTPRLVFIVGAPRSGTTWLQLLLAQHVDVTTMEETHLFDEYIGPMLGRWRRDRTSGRKIGLSVCLGEERFRELCRNLAAAVLTSSLVEKPHARVIVEKTPGHVFHGNDIMSLFPEAMFIHMIRDPRAVVASMIQASRSWARDWASNRAGEAAELWVRSVEAGRAIGTAAERYTEVLYEGLATDAVGELSRLQEWMGLEADVGQCETAVQACSADALRSGGAAVWSPKGMRQNIKVAARRAEVGGWRDELKRGDVRTVERIAEGWMREYGYTSETASVRSPIDAPLAWVRRLVRRPEEDRG